MTTIIAASTSQSRVFIAEGLPGPENPPIFQGCLTMGGASQSIGDVTFIYCPDPENYDRFIKVGEISGREENVETSVSGHFPINQQSNIIRWGRAKASLAIHVHFGRTSNPQNFNVFEKAVIFDRSAKITSTDIDEMGSLEESSAIGQSADISAADYYEVVPLNYVSRVDNLVTSPGVGVDAVRTYNQGLPLANRFAFYCAQDDALIYSLDGGSTWDSVAITAGATDVAVVNDVPVVVNGTTGSTYYVDLLGGSTTVVTVANSQNLTCIASVGNSAFVGGPAGYFGEIDDYTAGPTQLTLGTADDVISVHALVGGIIIAGTDGGDVFFSVDGVNFGSYEVEAGVGVTAVCAVNDKVFWAGTDTGNLYYTIDAGQNWALRNFPGSGSGTVAGIAFPELSVGWISHDPNPTTSTASKLLKTVGAGAVGTWYSVPVAGALPTMKVPKLASVLREPNLILATGPTDHLDTDGVLVVGT